MRVTPIILIAIGLFGLIYPESFFKDGSDARWVAIVLLILGAVMLLRRIMAIKKGNHNGR